MVRSYKQRLGVFIADREREAGAPLEGRPVEADYRGQAWIETFSAGREATGRSPPIVCPGPHGSFVWSGSVWLGLIWAGLDGEAGT